MAVLINVTAAVATTADGNLQHDMTVVLTQSLQYLEPQAIRSS
jgi:hypothetical protein